MFGKNFNCSPGSHPVVLISKGCEYSNDHNQQPKSGLLNLISTTDFVKTNRHASAISEKIKESMM